MNHIIQQLAECLDRLEYLTPDTYDNDEHKANWNAFLAQVRTTIQNPSCMVYCVEREGGDGLEQDMFLDETLADEWSNTIGGRRYNEYTIDRNTLNDMKGDHEHTTL